MIWLEAEAVVATVTMRWPENGSLAEGEDIRWLSHIGTGRRSPNISFVVYRPNHEIIPERLGLNVAALDDAYLAYEQE
jgi:hypothetical protein